MGHLLGTIEAHGTFLLVLANFLLWLTTWWAIREARRSAQGNLIAQLSRDFFSDTRMYRVRTAIEQKKPILSVNGGLCEDQDIDDYIGLLDMVAGFVSKKILDRDLAEDNFQEYAEDALKNKEVDEFINDVRRERNDNSLYERFVKFAQGSKI